MPAPLAGVICVRESSGRVPITSESSNFQIWGGVPIGFTFDILGSSAPGAGDVGFGWNVGVLFGGAVHFTPNIGLFGELGCGFGASGLAPDGFYDLAAHARDMHALVADMLGHERCAAAGGDLGGGVIQDLGLRFEGFVERQVLCNSVLPLLGEKYEAAGIPTAPPRELRMAADYFIRQGREADELAAELATPAQRRRYIAEFYGHRFWAAPGSFSREDVDFMTEPFADALRLRAGWGNYESALGARPPSEAPRFFEVSAVPTLALYGPEDHVIYRHFPQMCEVAFSELVGPFIVRDAGHFLQWERADLLNRTLEYFLADLR